MSDQSDSAAVVAGRKSRENQSVGVYVLVSSAIVVAWLCGLQQGSFLWIFALMVLVFLVWRNKVLRLTESYIQQQEVLLHRKRALRHSETAEWLNFVIHRWWLFSSDNIQALLKKNLNPILASVKPSFIESIEVATFVVGENTPFVKFVQVFECADSGGTVPLSVNSAGAPPPALRLANKHQLVLEADVALHSDDFNLVFNVRLGGRWMGMNLDVAIEQLNVSGKMQVMAQLNMDAPFPHLALISVSFIEKPEVWFNIRMLKAVQMMEIPLLKSWIHSLVMDGLTQALVDPGKFELHTMGNGPSYQPAGHHTTFKNASGIVTVTISCDPVKTEDLSNDEAVFTEDIRYCVLQLGQQKSYTQQTSSSCAWQDSCSFLVEDLSKDKLQLKVKAKRLLSTYTVASFGLKLADYPLELKNIFQTTLEDKSSKSKGSGKLSVTLEYTKLPPVDLNTTENASSPNTTAGVVYVCIHGASNLLAMDRNGSSDPYCILFHNGKKVITTHFVCRDRSPTWDVSTEFIVGDFTRTMLSFLVYDWDGTHANEDDFLGSAYILLTMDEPQIYHRKLALGFNTDKLRRSEKSNMGYIVVSAVFRPVSSVAKSALEMSYQLSTVDPENSTMSFLTSANDRRLRKSSSLRNKLIGLRDKKSTDSMGVRAEAIGNGVLELNIKAAKNLVPMDSNGYSDPYCEVKVNGERKFTTSIRKKTLNPIWDEWVTLQLPQNHETLDLFVWDRDPFFRRDFLGSLSFSMAELKHNCNNKDAWFDLERIKSGSIQLNFNVICAETLNSPTALVTDGKLNLIQENSAENSPGKVSQMVHSDTSTTIASSQPATTKLARKIFQLPSIKRSFSEANLKHRSGLLRRSREQLPLSDSQSTLDNSSTLEHSLSGITSQYKYTGVQGILIRVTGLQELVSQIYCKIRVDAEPKRGKNNRGKVVAKSSSLLTSKSIDFNLSFQVDKGKGVWRDAILIIDLKTSSREQLVSHQSTLQSLFQDEVDITLWIDLNSKVRAQVRLWQDFPRKESSATPLSPTQAVLRRNKPR